MACAHFHYSDVMRLVQSEQVFGYPYIVVEVALRVHDIVFLLQYGGYQFFSSCFAVGAGNADDGYVELTAVLTGDVLKSLQTVVNHDVSVVFLVLRFVDDGVCAPFFQRLFGKGIAVE